MDKGTGSCGVEGCFLQGCGRQTLVVGREGETVYVYVYYTHTYITLNG